MKTPQLCGILVEAVKKAVPLPVSVKIRAGWDDSSLNAVEVAKICESAGACRIAVHARTRSDFYREGTLRLPVIAAVKEAVSVPVIGNGDLRTEEDLFTMQKETGCDGFMIGRAAIGAPWIFSRFRAALDGSALPPFSKKEVIRHHLSLAFRYKPTAAGREMRMHMSHYLKGFRGAASLRDRASHLEREEEYLALLDSLPDENFTPSAS
jgi:tRNA-dihydrouridine synthase